MKKNEGCDFRTPRREMKVYQCVAGDSVLGFVEDRGSETYRIVLPGANFSGLLGTLSFDGATKRSRPDLHEGDAVFARVLTDRRGVEPRLTCCSEDPETAYGWNTGSAKYGKLARDATTCVVRSESSDKVQVVLDRLSSNGVKCQVRVGANGLIWIKTEKTVNTTIAANATINAERTPREGVSAMVDHLVATVRRQNS